MKKKITTFSVRLNQILSEKNMTKADLARLTGFRTSSISDWTTGKYEAKQDKVDILSQVLNVSPAYLMGYDVSVNNSNDTTNTPAPQPDYFTNAEEAIQFLMQQKVIAASTGINLDDYSEDEITQFANRLLDYARFLDSDKRK